MDGASGSELLWFYVKWRKYNERDAAVKFNNSVDEYTAKMDSYIEDVNTRAKSIADNIFKPTFKLTSKLPSGVSFISTKASLGSLSASCAVRLTITGEVL